MDSSPSSPSSGGLLWLTRRKTAVHARLLLTALLLTAASLFAAGCSGKYPSANNPYTAPGTYSYTITATDGTITHSATYRLKVTDR